MNLIERFLNDTNDYSALGLFATPNEESDHYYCTPTDMYVFARTGADGMHFGVIPESFGETVFAVTPDAFGEQTVYPVAKNITDFLALVCTLGDSTFVEEAPRMTRERFDAWRSSAADDEWLRSDAGKRFLTEKEAARKCLAETYALTEIADPYEHIHTLSDTFDATALHYPDEYYE